MKNRIIARLDIKSLNLIKGIHLEGLKIIGDPSKYAKKYFKENIDEIIIIDSVATLYDRKPNFELLKKITKDIFCPITIGGGIRSLNDAISILDCGCDKVAINTAVVKNPKLITKLAKTIGSQSVVVSIQAKRREGWWELFTDNGREKRGMDVMEWIQRVNDFGAGEILLTSIDQEGTRDGFDIDLINRATKISKCPIICSGGMGKLEHIKEVNFNTECKAFAIADFFHIQNNKIKEIKNFLSEK